MNWKSLNYRLFELKETKVKMELKHFETRSLIERKINNNKSYEEYTLLRNKEEDERVLLQKIEQEIKLLEKLINVLNRLRNNIFLFSPEYWSFLEGGE